MNHRRFFELAGEQAKLATCRRAKCGAVIVSESGEVIGAGFNAPPLGDEDCQYCEVDLDVSVRPKYDKTCCVHAEWNAMIDALKNHAAEMSGSTLYFMRVDNEGEFTDAGVPFCTVCSRLAMQIGLGKFALWARGEPKIYSAKEYNLATYRVYNSSEVF
jgi:deoxycytidylate deaminase